MKRPCEYRYYFDVLNENRSFMQQNISNPDRHAALWDPRSIEWVCQIWDNMPPDENVAV